MATKNNLPASAYAKPHTMSDKAVTVAKNPGKGESVSSLKSLDISLGNLSKSTGDETVKTSGIQTRGNGAATKGRTARGPMA